MFGVSKERAIPKDFPINEDITASEVHLIMNDGRSAGVIGIDQARYLAAQHELDLVEINSNAKPPIAKLLDYNKYRYQQEKHARQAHKKSNQLKEMRLSFLIGDHDLETKAKRAREFLGQGHFIRVFITLRGRQNVFPDKAKAILIRFQEMCEAAIEQPISQLGKKIQFIIKPKKKSSENNA